MAPPMADLPAEPTELRSDRGVFRAEYERELGTWLRRRLGQLCVVYAAFQILSIAGLLVASAVLEADEPSITLQTPAEPVEVDLGLQGGTEPGSTDAAATMDEPEPPAAADRAGSDAGNAGSIDPAADRQAAPEADSRGDSTVDAQGDARSDATSDAQEGAGVQTVPSERRRPVEPWAPKALQRSLNPGVAAIEAAEETFEIPLWALILAGIPSFGVIAWFGLVIRPKLFTRSELVAAATRMILALGLLNFGFECALLLAEPNAPVTPLLSIFFWHLTASLFLPWTWRESLKPIVPLLACWFLLRLGLAASDGEWLLFLASVAGAPLLFAPALILCYARLRWHQRRFKSGFVGRRFLAMRREFLQARAVHESLFPSPMDLEWLRFDFGYRPAADIGGDFIHAWVDEWDRFHVVLIDVTGHGLASAMSVARIHGEIERLRDEHPDDGPARMLARLNRYFHRLLSRHKLFATGVMLTVDPRTGEVRYANAGHPPVFIRSRGGVRELESTTFLLGAVDGDLFGEEERSVQLEEGDRIVLFTDGAYDARSPRGERFGLDRLRDILARQATPPKWPAYLMRLIETYEAGMPEDDLLIAEISFLQRRSISSVTGDELPVSRSEALGARA
jgi:hypothetical protein